MLNSYIIKNNLNSGKDVFDTHLHAMYEINFMLTENVEVMIEDKFFLSRRGDVFIFPPFTFHKIDSNGAPFSRFLLFFDDKEILSSAPTLSPAVSILKNTRPFVIHLTNTDTKIMLNLFSDAFEIFNSAGILYDFNNICAFGKLLSHIIQHIDESSNSETNENSNHELAKILLYVNNNLEKTLTVDAIAKKFNLSTTTLWHMMRSNLGISLKEYILKMRIAKAMELLCSGLSVTEVSNRAGFNSYSHFIRTFTKTVGVSPYRYGKQQQKSVSSKSSEKRNGRM